MKKVTITVETDDQVTSVTRQSSIDTPDVLLAQCLYRVADSFADARLEKVATAVESALRARTTPEYKP